MAIYSGFTHEKWWFSIVMLVYQRVPQFLWTFRLGKWMKSTMDEIHHVRFCFHSFHRKNPCYFSNVNITIHKMVVFLRYKTNVTYRKFRFFFLKRSACFKPSNCGFCQDTCDWTFKIGGPGDIMAGWWFGIFYIFPYIGNNDPNWLSYFSEELKPPTSLIFRKPGMHWWVREAFRTNLVRCDAGTDVYINVTQFRTISLTYNYIYIHMYILCGFLSGYPP